MLTQARDATLSHQHLPVMDREILMAGTRRKEQRAKTKKHRKGNEVLYEPQSYSLEARLEGEKERRCE